MVDKDGNYKIHIINNEINENCLSSTIPNHTTGFIDTGASYHYLHPEAPHAKSDLLAPPIQVAEPGGGSMQSAGMGNLHCATVPDAAKEAHILPGIHTSLLSAGKLCDAGCVAMFTKEDVKVIKVNDQTKRH